MTHYRRAVELAPDRADVHFSRAVVLESQGRLEEAAASYRRVLELEPVHPRARGQLAAMLNGLAKGAQQEGRFGEAAERYRQALALRAEDVASRYNLGVCLVMAGRVDEAASVPFRALRQLPSLLAPLTEMAWNLASHADPAVRDPGRAVPLAELAARLGPTAGVPAAGSAATLDVLAAAYAEQGEFNRAVRSAEAALEARLPGGAGGAGRPDSPAAGSLPAGASVSCRAARKGSTLS